MAINPEKNAVEQGLIARLIGKIKRIALDMGDSVAAETSRAQAAEASARTEVVQGENCTIDRTTASDGHDVYTVNADGKPQVQSDWNQVDSSAVDYIKNKPQNLVQDVNYVHTDNNYTDEEKTKLAGVESGAQVNVIEKVKVNGTEQGVTDKAVNISVPTASTDTPLMDGTASAGSSSQWARGDHVHPTDTSREAVSNKDSSIPSAPVAGHYPSTGAVVSFVNSSIATNTATFLGTIAESSLGLDYTATNAQIALALNVHSWESTPTNNDYCFVSVNDPQTTDVDEYRRFKFNGSVWAYEYTLNNSSFTQAQWDAINSGLTSSDRTAYNAAVTLLNSHVGDGSIHVTSSEKNAWNAKQDAISDLAAIRSGASAGASALQPSGNGSNLSVTPDGSSTGYDLGSSTTLKAFAQKFKNLVGALKALAFKDKVTDSDVNGTISDSHIASASTWNAKYTKPSTGIPKTDLASAVQTSLGKADSALQGHQSVTDGNPTLAWGTTSTVGTVGNTNLRVTMPSNPASGKQDAVSTDTDSSAFGDNTAIATGFGSNKLHLNVASRLWTYIQDKINSVLGLTSSSYGGKAATASAADKVNNGNNWTKTDNVAPAGLRVDRAYNNGWPYLYGNVITVGGTGDGQLLLGWSGTTGGVAPIYYRNRRDNASTTWSPWRTIAFQENSDATYMKASSGNKSLSYGGTTTIGTVDGSNVNLVMPAANADVFEVNANSTSFSDALSAYNDGKKKLVLIAGRQGTGSYVTRYEIPLYRVVVNGTTITQFVWIASDDAYNAASGSNTFGAIMYYKLSSSGWDIGSDNVDFAKVAGRTIGDVVSATANSALTWGASVQNLLLTKASGEVTVDVKNLIVGQVYWIHAGRAIKVKFKNSGASCTMYAYGTSATINNVNTFDIQDNINYSLHGSFSAAVIRSSESVYYVMMGYGDAH